MQIGALAGAVKSACGENGPRMTVGQCVDRCVCQQNPFGTGTDFCCLNHEYPRQQYVSPQFYCEFQRCDAVFS